MTIFPSLESLVATSFANLRPEERLTVAQAAEKYVVIRLPGAHSGPWSAEKTPYMVEPMETLTSLDHDGMIFVGPARTGKSQALLNWVAHTARMNDEVIRISRL